MQGVCRAAWFAACLKWSSGHLRLSTHV
jgi:hypothetical protein